MPSKIFGKWKLTKSDNFDGYMKQVGVNVVLRKAGALLSSTTEIIDEGDNKIRIDTQSTFKSANIVFILDQEIEENTMDGRVAKSVLKWDGESKLVQTQTWNGGKRNLLMEWIYEDEKMTLRMNCDGVICERIHERA